MARFRRTDEYVEDEVVPRGAARAGVGAAPRSRAGVQHGLQVADQLDLLRVILALGRREDDRVDQGAGSFECLARIGGAEPLLQLRNVLSVDLRQTGMQRGWSRPGLGDGETQR